jgi:serine/threonine protein kinase
LNHPNIATIYEADEFVEYDTTQLFIAMEYVSGQTVSVLAAQRELSEPEILEILLQIADALAEAHRHGIVHRDIKPSNVLITGDMRVKVVDFGLAKIRDYPGPFGSSVPLNTMPGTVMGTVSYMSPEQALGRDVDHRSDIFSLGVLGYELLTGKLPFAGSSSVAVIDEILHHTPSAPSRFKPRLNPELERIIRRMLQKEREQRFQTMRDVWVELDQVRRRVSGPQPAFDESQTGRRTQVLPESAYDQGHIAAASRVGSNLAVMSFVNITKNPADDWIGGGIAETVTADLKNVEGVTVIGRERLCEVISSYSGEDCDIPDESVSNRVGREVGARWIISGGYQRIGEMLRITARFVEVDTGEVLHTVKIDGNMSEIFELQDRIVCELSQQLQDDLLRTGPQPGGCRESPEGGGLPSKKKPRAQGACGGNKPAKKRSRPASRASSRGKRGNE